MALAGDHVQVLVGGYELTGDMNRVTVNDTYDMHDITAFSDGRTASFKASGRSRWNTPVI